MLLPFIGIGQVRLDLFQGERGPMDDINLYLDMRGNGGRSVVKTYWLNERMKFTLRPTVNRRVIQRLRTGGVLTKETLNEMGSEEVLSLAAYDIRCKYYFNRRAGVILRVFATGIDTEAYFYTLGYSKRF